MPSQVWSTDFFFEIFDHMINSRRIRKFGPFRIEKWTKPANSNSLWSRGIKSVRIRRFGPLFLFEVDQTCIFEEFEYGPNLRIRRELIMWSKISKRKKVDQTCFGMHMPSRDGGDSGPNVRPPCNLFKVNSICCSPSLFLLLSGLVPFS